MDCLNPDRASTELKHLPERITMTENHNQAVYRTYQWLSSLVARPAQTTPVRHPSFHDKAMAFPWGAAELSWGSD